MFGHNDNWNWLRDQFLVKITQIWLQWLLELVAWPIFGKKNYQNLVAITIGIVHRTNSNKIQKLELVVWPIFGKNYQNLVTMTIGICHVTNFW